MNDAMEYSVYAPEGGSGQIPEEAAPPFGAGIGGSFGGELNIDGTPLRLVTIVGVAILLLVLYHQAGTRFHVNI